MSSAFPVRSVALLAMFGTVSGVFAGEVLFHNAFNNDRGLKIYHADPGLKMGVTNGEFRIYGRTTDKVWNGDGARMELSDPGGALDISCTYRLAQRQDQGLVVLTVFTEISPLQIVFEWFPFGVRNCFWAQAVRVPDGSEFKLHPRGKEKRSEHIPVPFDDLDKKPHGMTLRIYESRKQVDFLADDRLVDTLLLKQPVGKISQASFEFETPAERSKYDIRWRDLIIRRFSEPKDKKRNVYGVPIAKSLEEQVKNLFGLAPEQLDVTRIAPAALPQGGKSLDMIGIVTTLEGEPLLDCQRRTPRAPSLNIARALAEQKIKIVPDILVMGGNEKGGAADGLMATLMGLLRTQSAKSLSNTGFGKEGTKFEP